MIKKKSQEKRNSKHTPIHFKRLGKIDLSLNYVCQKIICRCSLNSIQKYPDEVIWELFLFLWMFYAWKSEVHIQRKEQEWESKKITDIYYYAPGAELGTLYTWMGRYLKHCMAVHTIILHLQIKNEKQKVKKLDQVNVGRRREIWSSL